MVLDPAVSLVSINPAGSHNHPARDARALAQGRLSLLLALEVAPTGRATADRHGTPRIDSSQQAIPERRLASSRPEIRSLGTEFLDAETGGQKSTRASPFEISTKP